MMPTPKRVIGRQIQQDRLLDLALELDPNHEARVAQGRKTVRKAFGFMVFMGMASLIFVVAVIAIAAKWVMG